MAIQFNCVHCSRKIETPDDTAGKRCRCPDCGNIMPIPGGDLDVESTSRPAVFQSPENVADNPYATQYSPEVPIPPGTLYEPSDRSPIVLTLGIISLIAGLVSCGCCIVFPIGLGTGIPAWVMGLKDLREIDQGRRNPRQRNTLRSGMTCGIIGVCIATAFLVLRIAFSFLHLGGFAF